MGARLDNWTVKRQLRSSGTSKDTSVFNHLSVIWVSSEWIFKKKNHKTQTKNRSGPGINPCGAPKVGCAVDDQTFPVDVKSHG